MEVAEAGGQTAVAGGQTAVVGGQVPLLLGGSLGDAKMLAVPYPSLSIPTASMGTRQKENCPPVV